MRFAAVLPILSTVLFVSVTIASQPETYRQVEERRAGQLGIRKIVGRHLRLYTDLPASNAVDELTVVFDAAVEQWADYFGILPQRVAGWRMQGFLMQERAKFAALGLLPEARFEFENGYSQGHELWLDEQPSDYYRRHLLLHEGTHGFMFAHLGEVGPGWYMEGMAELLGTHRWQDGQLRLSAMPASREEAPMWGRIKLIRDASREGKALGLSTVLAFDKRRMLTTDQYAWSWALCKFLDSHPRWQEEFRQLPSHVADSEFNEQFLRAIPVDQVAHEWNAFVATLDYGYDPARMAIVQRGSNAVTAKDGVSIAADRGWQATGWLLQAGKEYHVSAKGRYQIARDSEPWPCEPGGVTLEYLDGNPLGMLLGAMQFSDGDTFSQSLPIGLARTIKPDRDAELYLRVNDSPARLSDNEGELQATIDPR